MSPEIVDQGLGGYTTTINRALEGHDIILVLLPKCVRELDGRKGESMATGMMATLKPRITTVS